jgi:hypothetical protein
MPILELDVSEPKIGFHHNIPNNDFITNLFARPED